jgi:plastocyanin
MASQEEGPMRMPSPVSVLQLLAVAALVPLGGCGVSGPAHEAAPTDAAVVELTNSFDFAPDQLTIPLGGTVEWRNVSFFTHTVTADPAMSPKPGEVQIPPAAMPFDSGDIPAGEIYRHTFDVPGIYRYLCRPHHDDAMVGTIVVSP